jgi:hypothetical protein
MLARYYVELPLAADAVEAALTRSPSQWLPGLAEEANRRGDILLAEVGFGEHGRIARRVAIELAAPVTMPTKTIVPMRWTPASGTGLFPALDADLEVAPLGPGRTQLAMSARYVPPLGALGRAMDRAVLFRVAEATIKDFLDRVREAVLMDAGMAGSRGNDVA